MGILRGVTLPDHRPRSASELIDAAIQLMRRDYARYCLMGAAVAVPWQVVRLVATRTMDVTAVPTSARDFGPLLTVGAIAIVFFAWTEAAVSLGVARAYVGERPDVRRELVAGMRRWPVVLLATAAKYLAMALFTMVGVFVAIVAGAIAMLASGQLAGSGGPSELLAGVLAVSAMLLGAAAALVPIGWFAAVPMTAILEARGVLGALGRSRTLTKGLWRHAVGVSALAWVVVALPSLGASLLAGLLGLQIVEDLVQVAATVLLTPFYVAAITVLYYDLRIRKEGYDLELMASRLAHAVPDAGPDLPATRGA